MANTKGNAKESIDFEEREQIIFHRHYDPANYKDGGICKFTNLNYSTVKKLISRGYLDPTDYFNTSPEVCEFVSFVEQHNPGNWFFHGYVVSAERDDTRVTIEGIGSYAPIKLDDLIDFLRFFRYANALAAEKHKPVYCWYD